MVCSCGWGHPRPRCSYRGLGQSPSGNSSLFPTLYSLRSNRGLGQSPGGNYALLPAPHSLNRAGDGMERACSTELTCATPGA